MVICPAAPTSRVYPSGAALAASSAAIRPVAPGLFVGNGPATAHASGPMRKLGRGLANTVTGVLELPAQIGRTTELDGSIAGASLGVLRGVGWSLGRTLAGMYEVVTFLLPNHPEVNRTGGDPYRTIVEPEFVVFRRSDKP